MIKTPPKVMILGINGFLGEHLIKYIIQNNLIDHFALYCFDVTEKYAIPKCFNFEVLDMLNYQNQFKAISRIKPDYILNLIGCFGNNNFENLFMINVGITQNLLKAIVESECDIKNILLVGSAAEYGYPENIPVLETSELKPVNLYGLTKQMQTNLAFYYARNYGINFSLARPFNIIGKNISSLLSVGAFIHQINESRDGDKIYVGNLRPKRDFIDIADTIEALWLILLKGRPSNVYNICSGESVSIETVLRHLIKHSKKDLKIEIDKKKFKEIDVLDIYGSNVKLVDEFKWSIKTGIVESLKKALI